MVLYLLGVTCLEEGALGLLGCYKAWRSIQMAQDIPGGSRRLAWEGRVGKGVEKEEAGQGGTGRDVSFSAKEFERQYLNFLGNH